MTIANSLEGFTILVTGAAGGIGAVTARTLSARGARLLLTDRDTATLASLAAELAAEYRVADLDDRNQITDLADWADQRGMDALVNNAGIVSMAPIEDFPDADWDRVIEINLTAVHLLTRNFARCRIARGGGGAIVNIASMSYKGMTRQIAYVASKGGVVSLTKGAAMELARHKIRVNAVAPGMTETEMTNPADGSQDRLRLRMMEQIPLRRYGEPQEIASVVAFLISRDASYVTGEVIHVSGGARL
ncbi:MAG TPA: SDR family oxidoreductase [Sphingopyxis sp.]|uniref:SDR family NAD(P)-dependent oxidoreductase n=1 Tax=Sphingopyxis sp. TaxID=1908224 RepID=UPI002BD36CBB|nr:SDR family oxidoreductase [Sphingopyxis sp.]HWW58435.1 SDR family oxidoreductase [Sphingopyxis sp.]